MSTPSTRRPGSPHSRRSQAVVETPDAPTVETPDAPTVETPDAPTVETPQEPEALPTGTQPRRDGARRKRAATKRSDVLPRKALAVERDGMPAHYDDGVDWLRNGFRRHRQGTMASLLIAWTGIWLAPWAAVAGVVLGVFVVSGLVSSAPVLGTIANWGGGPAINVASAVVGGILGVVLAPLAVVVFFVVLHPIQAVVSVTSGAIIAAIILGCAASFERLSLRVRGYRRLSRDEVRRVAPLVKDVADAMNLGALPRFAIDDNLIPNAWSHTRTIVLTTGILQTLDDPELRAVLAHELHHWSCGDSVGLQFVWAAAWPVAVTLNLGLLLAGRLPTPKSSGASEGGHSGGAMRGVLFIIGWLIAFPAWIFTRYVIVPIVAASQRRYEYEADAGAAQLGYAAELSSALRKLAAFEGGRTGWEAAMSATHPPTELRLEALQPAQPDDWEYQEEELRGPTMSEARRIFRALGPKRK